MTPQEKPSADPRLLSAEKLEEYRLLTWSKGDWNERRIQNLLAHIDALEQELGKWKTQAEVAKEQSSGFHEELKKLRSAKRCSCEPCGCNPEFKVMCEKHVGEMYQDMNEQFPKDQ